MSDDLSNNGSDDEPEIKELWQFPCQFMFKAMAVAKNGIEDEIIAVIQQHIPGDYTPKLNPSRSGTYVAVSVTFVATSKQQLDDIYLAVNAIEDVKFCL